MGTKVVSSDAYNTAHKMLDSLLPEGATLYGIVVGRGGTGYQRKIRFFAIGNYHGEPGPNRLVDITMFVANLLNERRLTDSLGAPISTGNTVQDFRDMLRNRLTRQKLSYEQL